MSSRTTLFQKLYRIVVVIQLVYQFVLGCGMVFGYPVASISVQTHPLHGKNLVPDGILAFWSNSVVYWEGIEGMQTIGKLPVPKIDSKGYES